MPLTLHYVKIAFFQPTNLFSKSLSSRILYPQVQVEFDFPDQNGRVKFLEIHTANRKEHKRLVPDVDLTDLAAKTKNFTVGAEIKGLV